MGDPTETASNGPDTSPATPDFRVLVLGPFAVYRNGDLLDAGTWQRSVLTLFELLVVAGEHRRLRDEVVDHLWPDASPEAGASNLRYVLSLLRKNLGGGEPSPILVERGWIFLNPVYGWDIDMSRFERLAAESDRESLEQALRVYRGEALQKNPYDDWAAPVREHLRRTWVATALKLADRQAETGDLEASIGTLQTVLEHDPLEEEALRRLLPLLATSGRRTEALRRYTQFEERLRRELDAEPSAEVRAAALALRRSPPGKRAADESPDTSAEATSGPKPGLPIGSYLGSLPVGSLVGRRRELETVLARLEAVARGQGQMVLVAGEPGVGKTRLAQEVTRHLVERGFTVAAGRCYEIESGTPYYPFLDALASLYAGLPPEFQRDATERWAYLAHLLPELMPGTRPEVGGPQNQQHLYRAVTGLLETAARLAPIAVLLDDLHWSDMASLRLLLHIARHTRESRVFLLGTYRDVEIARHHPLEGALLDLAREDLVTRVSLGRLTRDETAALTTAMLGSGVVSEGVVTLIHGTTEGNPFFVHQVVRTMRERGDLFETDGVWGCRAGAEAGISESIRAAVGRRLSGLTVSTQEVLHEASVLGHSFLFDDLLAVSSADEDAIEGALHEACRAGLIHERGDEWYSFDHALTRQTVAAELSARRKRRLHRASAEAKAQRSARHAGRRAAAAEIALHYLEAGADEEALRWSLLAGDAAEGSFAHDEAERHYRTSLEIAAEIEDCAREAEAVEKLGEVLITASRQKEALPLEERALELYRTLGDLPGEGRAVTRISWALSGLGGHDHEAAERVRTAIARLEPHGPSFILADLRATLTGHLVALGQIDEALDNADRLRDLARATGYERYLAAAETMRAYVLWQSGRTGEARPILENSLPSLEAVGDLYGLVVALQGLGYAALMDGDWTRARTYLDRARDVALRRNDSISTANIVATLAFLEMLRGDWGTARARAEEAVRMVADRVDQPLTAFPLGVLGLFRVLTGDDAGIEAYLTQCLQIGSETHDSSLMSHLAWAQYDLLAGRPAAAVARLDAIVGGDAARIADGSMWVYPNLGRAQLRVGNLDGAENTIAAARAAIWQPNRLVNVDLRAVEAELLVLRGRWAGAATAVTDALAVTREIGLPYHEAQIHLVSSKLCLARGEHVNARQELGAALALFERLGARPDAAHARDVLQQLA